jgi:hypothetical protein
MGVLEITLLHIKAHIKATDVSLLQNLRTIRSQLKTNSRFYISATDHSQLYIFGLWPTLEAHHDFLASPDREKILGPQEGQTEFIWGLHIDNVFSMDELPLTADIMRVDRFVGPASDQGEVLRLEVSVTKEQKITANYPRLVRTRMDPKPDEMELFVVSGLDGPPVSCDDGVAMTITNHCAGSILKEQWALRDLEAL